MRNKKKYAIYILLLIGVICTFAPFEVNFPSVYLRILGIGLSMFSLYIISSKLTSKESSEDQNLKL